MSKKEITLDDLAGMVKRGFDDTSERIDSTNREIASVKSELKQEMKKGFQRVDDRFSYLHSRLDLIEKDIRDIRSKLHPAMDKKTYLELEQRVTLIEEKMGISY